MIYFIFSFILLIYFELLGRWVLSKTEKKLTIYFPIGFITIAAVLYPTLLITINNLSFYFFFCVCFLLFVISIILIVKDFSKLDKRSNPIALVFLFIICIVLSYYSYNTSLGDLHGFDTVYYINFVVGNIGKKITNNFGVYLNGPLEESLSYYTGQVYYYYVGAIIYFFGKVSSFLHLEYFYETAFIWIFQILFNFLLSAILVESFLKTKNRMFSIIPSLLIVFVVGKTYFYNVYGFFGNSMLLISISYSCLFLFEYFANGKQINKYLAYLSLLSGCSFSSSGIFVLFISLVCLFFVMYKDNMILKEYSIILLFPLINLFNMERMPLFVVYLIPLIICFVLFMFNTKFNLLISDRKIKFLFLLFVIAFFILSRFYSNGLFDFNGLLNNTSQNADMTFDYFHLYDGKYLENIYKLFALCVIVLSCCFGLKQKYYMYFIVMILLFFNPFSCNFINHYIKVYYRAYTLIINPFSIILSFDFIISKIKNSYILYFIYSFLALIIIYNIDYINPTYYHYSHKPNEDYNYIYKMSNDDIDIIREIKSEIIYYDDKCPYIITGNILTQGIINNGKYLFGRSNYIPVYWTNSEKKLYEIFYTPKFIGDSINTKPDYNNMLYYLKNAKVNYVVINKSSECYDVNSNSYTYLYLKTNDVCNMYPIYENNTYALYRVNY